MAKDVSSKKYKLIKKIMAIDEENLLDKIEKELLFEDSKIEKIDLKKFADKILSEEKELIKRFA